MITLSNSEQIDGFGRSEEVNHNNRCPLSIPSKRSQRQQRVDSPVNQTDQHTSLNCHYILRKSDVEIFMGLVETAMPVFLVYGKMHSP